MPVSDDDMIVSTTDYLVTENRLHPKATVAEVAAFVKEQRTSGQIIFTVNQGGTQGVVVVERTKITDQESEAVRKAMGMDYEVEIEEG